MIKNKQHKCIHPAERTNKVRVEKVIPNKQPYSISEGRYTCRKLTSAGRTSRTHTSISNIVTQHDTEHPVLLHHVRDITFDICVEEKMISIMMEVLQI